MLFRSVGVAGGVFIEVPVILAGTEFSILLFDKEERGGLGQVGGFQRLGSHQESLQLLSSHWRTVGRFS